MRSALYMKTKDLFDLYGIPTGSGGRVIPSNVIQALLNGIPVQMVEMIKLGTQLNNQDDISLATIENKSSFKIDLGRFNDTSPE